MGELEPEVAALLRKYALQNALEYDGQGQVGSVMGRVMGENADLRSRAKELTGSSRLKSKWQMTWLPRKG